MPQALLPGDVHVNVPLSNVARAYIQSETGFVADKVFPPVPVAKQSDSFWRYSREDWNRNEMKKRAPRTESAGAGFGTDRDTYFAEVWALHNDISDPARANADSIFNMDRDATNFLTMKGLISREVNFASTFLATGVWSNEVDGVSNNPGTNERLVWSDAASTPIEDVRAAKRIVGAATGFRPNTLTLGQAVYDTLVDHPDIIDRVKYGQTSGGPAMVNQAALAALFEVDRVLVASAVKNSAAEGATEDSDFIVGNHALLTFSPAAPSIVMPSAGYTFNWTGLYGGSQVATRIKKFRMEALASDRVEIEMAYDQKVVAADLGFMFLDIVTSSNVFATSQ